MSHCYSGTEFLRLQQRRREATITLSSCSGPQRAHCGAGCLPDTPTMRRRALKPSPDELLGKVQRGDDGRSQENQAEEHHFNLQTSDGGSAVQVGSVNIVRDVGSVNMVLQDSLADGARAPWSDSELFFKLLKILNISAIQSKFALQHRDCSRGGRSPAASEKAGRPTAFAGATTRSR
jgi:hypothetical protein